ncbi:hypothetical protein BOTBODRAFT_25769 [Botryobasidium botryosum FD-172 SS1]|uniref:Uncharacterized protein n=1 Tax=Botryobasidium botryosum (strain FD-172 SS1) TaxID=930990 RepID=A0A067N0J2_BOTB1|nr:hypothetical protein BOTBODRAFT_25769 [Botryobasidium botryosum FD-172 SS1]
MGGWSDGAPESEDVNTIMRSPYGLSRECFAHTLPAVPVRFGAARVALGHRRHLTTRPTSFPLPLYC